MGVGQGATGHELPMCEIQLGDGATNFTNAIFNLRPGAARRGMAGQGGARLGMARRG